MKRAALRVKAAGSRCAMPRILVANIDNENLMADERARTVEYCRALANVAARMAWFAEPGDIVVLPRDLSPEFKEYIGSIMGYAPEAVSYVTPEWDDAPLRTLGSRELLHLGVREKLARLMRDRSDWSIFPYCYERSTELLAEALCLDTKHDVRPFMRQGGAELMNDKRVFRSLAAGRGVPLARGTVCIAEADLVDAIGSMIGETGAVIVKQDRHGGGLGNLIVSRTPSINGLGATDVIVTGQKVPLDAAAEVWRRLAYHGQAPLIVEVYYPALFVVTAEFRIDARENSVAFLNCGEVRQAPVLNGLIMPWSLTPQLAGSFVASATELARLACDLGYDGLINIDGIVTPDGCVICNEFNGRIGGCSHIHHILQLLAGPAYGNSHVVASHSRNIALGLDRVLDLLRHAKLDFDAAVGRGVILTAEDTAGSGHVEYLSIARSRPEALQLEAEFERMLDEGAPRERPAGIEHLERILSHLAPLGSEARKGVPEGESAPRQGAIRRS